ncbi:licodione synthase-like [Rosa sericea]
MALELVLLYVMGIISLLIFTRRVLFHTHRVEHLPPSPLALPIIGHFHLLNPLIHRSFQSLSFRFGPIFSLRLGSVPCIVVTSPELAKEFLKTHELSFVSRVHNTAIERITYDSSLAFSPYGAYWKFIKKVTVNELLSSRSVSKFHSIRADEYSRLLRLFAERAKSCLAVNLSEELPRLCHNVIGQMMLGKYSTAAASNTERAEEARLVVREATRIFGELNLCDFNMVCKKLDLQGFGKRIEDTHVKFDELVEKVVNEREQLRIKNNKIKGGEEDEKEVKDFLSILLDMLEDESSESVEVGFSRVHIKAVITDLFTASTDTTAIAMEWALAELINHPTVLEKAREEIDSVVGNGRIVEESDCPNLPYIQAIIKETFRLHPPVPMVARISVEDCKVGKYVIPKNTMLFVNNWAIGRDPKNWEKPLDFWPERFLEHIGGAQTSGMDVRGQHFQYLPFGTGRRICPGINLTMKMVPSLVAAMIQCFDWKVIPSKKMNNDDVVEMDEKPGLTTPRAHDLVCSPVARFNLLNILKP